MGYPKIRMRRLRRSPHLRSIISETSLKPENFILPLFVRQGKSIKKEIISMPGVSQMSVDVLVEECRAAIGDGITAVILFGIPDHKDSEGTGAYDDNGIIPQAVRALKSEIPEIIVITDVCMCEYTDHGHCGIIK
ncbi:MAG: porphobilinogen synthase, partial [Candidatus Latescibacteria bacterium]|nr:porphobilinogen synthase [Candidatus Latescibacterota bacterium]